MAQPYDLPLEQLRSYLPALTRESDFESFWKENVSLVQDAEPNAEFQLMDYPADGVEVYDVYFTGFGDARIHAWYVTPDSGGPHPGLVVYHGYNASYDGNIHDMVNWGLHGYAVLGVHVRGQYLSEDNSVSSGHNAGWMTKGILDKMTYYYRGVYLDALKALDVLCSRPEVDGQRIGVTGASQGGGLSLAVGALSSVPKVVVADYPYLSHFRRAVDLAPRGPYLEINEFFRRNGLGHIEEQAMKTLSYFDVMNLAPWIQCHVLVSIGLVDEITPPSTVFAAYNHLATKDKEIKVYRYFGHEFIPQFQLEKLAFLKQNIGTSKS